MSQIRIFISHATADTAFANRLATDLRELGADVWLDSSHIGPGDFVARINAALQRDVLLLILSPDAVTSPWVQQEMNAAIARVNQKLMRPPIIIQARPCPPQDIPPLWTVYHRYDATQNYAVAVAKVMQDAVIVNPSLSTLITQDQTRSESTSINPSALPTISHPWLVRNIFIFHLLGLLGLAPVLIFYLSHPAFYGGRYQNEVEGCTGIFYCYGSADSPLFNFVIIVANVIWVIAAFYLIVIIIQSIILTCKMHRWGWLFVLIAPIIVFLYPIFGFWAFALWGPKTKREKRKRP